MIQQIRNEIKQLTPESGYNVILLDSFAPQGEKLTRVKHTESKQEALLFQQKYKEFVKNGKVHADSVFIYDNHALSDFDSKTIIQFNPQMLQ